MTNTVSTEQRTSPRNAEHRRPVNGKAMTVPSLRIPHLRLGALIAVGLAAFLVGWVAMNRGDDAPSVPGSGASAASESELKAFADSVSHPVYWAGPKEGYTYELTQTTNGLVYVRYLPEGTDVGRSSFAVPHGRDVPSRRRVRRASARGQSEGRGQPEGRRRRPGGLQPVAADERVSRLSRGEVPGRGLPPLA